MARKLVASEKPISSKNKELVWADDNGKVSVDGLEVPQFENLQDAIADAGSEAELVSYINSKYANDAKQAGRLELANATKVSERAILEKSVRETVANFSIKAAPAGITAKEAKDVIATIRAKMAENPNYQLTAAEFQALLQ